MISPSDETCFVWNQQVERFLAGGAVRGEPIIQNNRVVGYRKPHPVTLDKTNPDFVGLHQQLPSQAQTNPTGAEVSALPASQGHLSSLTPVERESIESACSTEKNLEGPAAYNRCLNSQLVALAAGPRRPDLSSLAPVERESIESACSTEKNLQGPAAYNRCLNSQLVALAAGPRRPDLSSLAPVERESIESACSTEKNLQGPAAYNRCLDSQLAAWAAGPRRPDLSSLAPVERESIESAARPRKISKDRQRTTDVSKNRLRHSAVTTLVRESAFNRIGNSLPVTEATPNQSASVVHEQSPGRLFDQRPKRVIACQPELTEARASSYVMIFAQSW